MQVISCEQGLTLLYSSLSHISPNYKQSGLISHVSSDLGRLNEFVVFLRVMLSEDGESLLC